MKLSQLKLVEQYAKIKAGKQSEMPKDLLDLVDSEALALFTESGEFIGYQELEMEDAFLDIHEDISHTKDTVSLHSHTYWEILFVKSGNLQYLVGDERYQLHKNDIVLIPPGISHKPLFLKNLREPYRRTVLWVNAEFFQNFMSLFFRLEALEQEEIRSFPSVMQPAGSLFGQIEQIFAALLYEKQHFRTGSELLCIGLFTQLVSLLYRVMHYQNVDLLQPEKTDLLDKILHYIENHLAQPISLKSISEHFLCSQSAVSHLFKEQMDISFYKVVTQRRLIEAKNGIAAGRPLNEIAQSCGFSDYSAFYKTFKKEYGISPREFRQHIKPADTILL